MKQLRERSFSFMRKVRTPREKIPGATQGDVSLWKSATENNRHLLGGGKGENVR